MNNINKDKAIEIAKKGVVKMGCSLAEMKIEEACQYNTPFNKWLPEDDESKYDVERREKLKGKKYWAIHFCDKNPHVRGGAVCIFVDASTGEILASLLEQ